MDSSPQPRRSGCWSEFRIVLWMSAVMGVFLVAWGLWFVYGHMRHYRADRRMEEAILKLSLNVPPEFTDGQWAYCILRTWNLHSNYAHVSYTPTAAIERMSAELLVRIDAGANRNTIDWFWDEYMQASPSARNYRRFHPTIPENREELESGLDDEELLWQRSQYRDRTARMSLAVTRSHHRP